MDTPIEVTPDCSNEVTVERRRFGWNTVTSIEPRRLTHTTDADLAHAS
jgi:hypothetical protein